jgi:hypothetical protein
VLVVGTGSIVGLEGLGYVHSGCTAPHPAWMSYLTTIGFLAVTAGACARSSLLRGRVNRLTAALLMMMFALSLTMDVAAHLLGLGDAAGLVLLVYTLATSATVYALFVDRRFWPTAACCFVALLESCLVPEHVWHAMAAGASGLTLNLVGVLMRGHSVSSAPREEPED